MSLSGYADPEYGAETYGSGGLFFGGTHQFPRCSCWISFTTNPGDEPVWEDVSLYFRGFSTKRGRQYELDQFAAGTATITLDNRDRRFDPTYVDSPYYPNVLPMKRIKITSTWGVDFTQFDGYVDGWPQSYNQPHEARVDVPVTDAFKVSSLAQMPGSVYEYEVRQDSPTHWWRMGEKQGAAALDSGSASLSGELHGQLQYAGTGSSPFDGDTSIGFVDPNADGGGYFQAITSVVAGDFTIEFWTDDCFSPASPLVQTPTGVTNKTSARPYSWQFTTHGQTIVDGSGNYVSSQGRVIFNMFNASGDFIADCNTGYLGSLADAGWHHIAVTRSANTVTLYTDGVARNSDTFAFAFAGGSIIGPMDDYGAGAVVGLDEIALYDHALSAARVQAHYDAAVSAWSGETSDERVARALDVAQFSATDRNLEAGVAALGSAVLSNADVTSHVQQIELAEGGAFFYSADGTATFYNRHHLSTAPGNTSVATFGDGAGENKYSDIVVAYDDTHIINEVRITRAGGIEQVVEDATSLASYLKRSFQRSDVHTESDSDSLYAAEALLARFKDPSVRIESITIQPQRDPENLFPLVLDLDLLDVITVKRRPQALGDPITETVVVEGISHTVTPDSWATTLQLGQVPPAVWILEDPVFGVLGETTRLAY